MQSWQGLCHVFTKSFRYLKWRNPEPYSFWGWVSPYISRIHILLIQLILRWGLYLHFRYRTKCWAVMCWDPQGFKKVWLMTSEWWGEIVSLKNFFPKVYCWLVVFHQPIWKICASQNWIIFPRDRGENKQYLSCHHLVYWWLHSLWGGWKPQKKKATRRRTNWCCSLLCVCVYILQLSDHLFVSKKMGGKKHHKTHNPKP